MSENLRQFYAQLTPFYDLFFPDWNQSINRQANLIDNIIQNNWKNDGKSILDAACGIGTQSLGLAHLGYQITASDLSSEAVDRARTEANERGLSIQFSTSDMRSLFDHHQEQFDFVIACDNAIPHILTDDGILQAFHQFYQCLEPGGGCMISIRDYDAEDRTENTFKVYGNRQVGDLTYLIFQHWIWEGDYYDFSIYFIEDDGSSQCQTHVMRSRYYAVGIPKLIKLMKEAGFSQISRLDDVFIQPVLIGTRES